MRWCEIKKAAHCFARLGEPSQLMWQDSERTNYKPLVLRICSFSHPLGGTCNGSSPICCKGSRTLIRMLQVIFSEVRDCFLFPFDVVFNFFWERFFARRLLCQKSSYVAGEFVGIRWGHSSKDMEWAGNETHTLALYVEMIGGGGQSCLGFSDQPCLLSKKVTGYTPM